MKASKSGFEAFKVGGRFIAKESENVVLRQLFFEKVLVARNIFTIFEYGKAQGDFKVDGKYTFEIGGRSKDYSQIAGLKNSYVFAAYWDMPDGAKLPLWMLGFLY